MNAQNFPFIINIYTIISITTTLQHLFVHEERDFQVYSVNQLISQQVSVPKRETGASLYTSTSTTYEVRLNSMEETPRTFLLPVDNTDTR